PRSAGSVGSVGEGENFWGIAHLWPCVVFFDEVVSTSVQDEERNRRQIGADLSQGWEFDP
ncbi:hypothetical protein C7B67_26350, partial [filamentous cyanobacterium Phorm 6]